MWICFYFWSINLSEFTEYLVTPSISRISTHSRCLSMFQFSLITQSWPTLCDPMNWSTPGFPVHHQLPELAQTHVHPSHDCRWCHPTTSSFVIPFSSCLQSFLASGSFPMSQFFASGDQSIGASTSTSVLPVNIQNWFPLGWTCWISLQCKGLSRVFSNTTVQKHQFFKTQLWRIKFIVQLSHPYILEKP